MGREKGGGSGWGTHVYLWWIHVDILAKPIQYCKVKKEKIIIKIKTKHANATIKISFVLMNLDFFFFPFSIY